MPMPKTRKLLFGLISVYAVIFLVALLLASQSADAVIHVGTNVHFSPSGISTTYTVNATMAFSAIRVESTALYLNNSIFKHTPDAGSITVYIESYKMPNSVEYTINTTGGTTEVNHTIGGLGNSQSYSIYVDNVFWKSQSTNATGVLMFNHSASNHTFAINQSANVVCSSSIYNSAGNAVAYNWGNWTVTGGATHVGNHTDANQTYIKATNNGSIDGTATISWNAGYFANGGNQIAIDNNIKYVYSDMNTTINFTAGDDESTSFYWISQTFTTSYAYKITGVTLELYRWKNPGNVTVSIRNVNATGAPTGNDLTSGTILQSDMAQAAWKWYTFDLTPYSLSASTQYAIVVRADNNTDDNTIYVAYNSTAQYTGGQPYTSGDGNSWSDSHNYDLVFRTHGSSPSSPSDVWKWAYSAVDNDTSFQVTVPASSTLWVYYEIQSVGAVPSGTYTQTFTWTAT